MKITILLLILICLSIATNAQTNSKIFKGIIGRTWYIGGLFDKAYQVDGQNLTVSNLATWNGTTFGQLGDVGPNGEVKVINTDLCRNVYVGGSFTQINSIKGPAARWNTLAKTWEQIGKTADDLTWSTGAYINDIQVNCRNYPKAELKCPCSVYLVGKFTATIKSTGAVATNVIKYEFSSSTWSNLGGASAHKMGDGEVNAVYVKQAGFTDAINIVWFAGNFTGKFQRAHVKNDPPTWGFTDKTIQTKINGEVKAIFYKIAAGTATDTVYIGGDFTNLTAEGGTCNRVCYFDYKTEKFYPVGTENVPNAVVNYVELNNNDVYIGGEFTNADTKYVAKLPSGKTKWEKIGTNDATVVKDKVTTIDVCNRFGGLQIDCNSGATAVIGPNTLAYYTGSEWNDFGRGINGKGNAVISQFSSASSLSFATCVIISVVTALFISF